eukprot:7524448-Alexandrium_andersonii.AAC.1
MERAGMQRRHAPGAAQRTRNWNPRQSRQTVAPRAGRATWPQTPQESRRAEWPCPVKRVMA